LAQYLSGDRAAPYRRTLADQFERRTGPDDWRPNLSYPHALSFVEYVIEQNGFRTWWSILDALHRGLSPTDALWEALRRSPEQLAVEWGESLEADRRRR
jgi:hypothetical protein